MELVFFEGHQVEVRRKAFQRRLGVTIHPSGVIRVSANRTLSQKEILKFLASHRDWVKESLAQSEALKRRYPRKRFASGEVYPFLGREYRLQISQGPKVALRFEGAQLLFSSPVVEDSMTFEMRERYFESFKKSYKQVAKKVMSERIHLWADKMNLHPASVQFRGQKTIWGSCSADNKISLNFKLIVAPLNVIDYVLIHELAHIQHKNHSKAFWSLVEQYTDARHFSRQWLRENQFSCDFLSKKSELDPSPHPSAR